MEALVGYLALDAIEGHHFWWAFIGVSVLLYFEHHKRSTQKNSINKEDLAKIGDEMREDWRGLARNLAEHEKACVEKNNKMIVAITTLTVDVKNIKSKLDRIHNK